LLRYRRGYVDRGRLRAMILGRSNMSRCAGARAGLMVLAFGFLLHASEARAAPDASAIKEALEDSTRPLESAGFKLNREVLTSAYRVRDFEPVWTAPEMADAFAGALGDANREGLDPERFDLSTLKSALAGSALTPVDRELLLSDRFLAYAQVMAQGQF